MTTDDGRPAAPDTPSFTTRLSAAAAEAYAAIIGHPFLNGLAYGALERASFQFYLVQDAHYLLRFSRALSLLAARAPSAAVTELFARHTAVVLAVERSLHAELLAELAVTHPDGANAGIAPTTLAYSSHLIATCATEPFSDGVAAILPCYWIYREVGKELLARSSPDPLYARWIDTYGGEEFAHAVREIVDLTDAVGARLNEDEQRSAIAHFVVSARYEWMFWDAAYKRAWWPV